MCYSSSPNCLSLSCFRMQTSLERAVELRPRIYKVTKWRDLTTDFLRRGKRMHKCRRSIPKTRKLPRSQKRCHVQMSGLRDATTPVTGPGFSHLTFSPWYFLDSQRSSAETLEEGPPNSPEQRRGPEASLAGSAVFILLKFSSLQGCNTGENRVNFPRKESRKQWLIHSISEGSSGMDEASQWKSNKQTFLNQKASPSLPQKGVPGVRAAFPTFCSSTLDGVFPLAEAPWRIWVSGSIPEIDTGRHGRWGLCPVHTG